MCEPTQGGYRLINPLLECDVATSNFERRELERFEDHVEELVAKLIEDGRARDIAVYFQDLIGSIRDISKEICLEIEAQRTA